MPSDYENGAKKTIDISIKAEKMTADVLKSALQEFLSGKAEKKGRMTFKQFIRLLCPFSCLFYREGGSCSSKVVESTVVFLGKFSVYEIY